MHTTLRKGEMAGTDTGYRNGGHWHRSRDGERAKSMFLHKHRTILGVVKGLGTETVTNSESETGKDSKAECA